MDTTSYSSITQNDTFFENKEVVGFDSQVENVIEQLVEQSEDVEVVPIVGMHGIGKTTLARKICSNSQISTEFSKNIWVDVGRSYEPKDILFQVIQPFKEGIEEFRHKDVKELRKVISNFVTKEDRCLIVLDDVWAKELVDSVKSTLPANKKGHRIMMTTCLSDVASHASNHPYDMKLLTPDESFQLLEKRVFGFAKCPPDLVELGKRIARKCSGLPLALVVIAGELKVRQNRYNWERIENNVWPHLVIENDRTTCWKIVETSYESLPQERKRCFLYCLAFPKGYDIPTQKLIRLWIAEGLIRSSPPNTFEYTAESYLLEFEKKGLVTLSREITGQLKKLRCNDMFYEYYKMEAVRESVFQELRLTPQQVLPPIQDPDISRRLHIESSVLSYFISKKHDAEHVRSFLCFPSEDDTQTKSSALDIEPILKAFPLIRVLKIESVKIPFSKYLSQLYLLRYISISGDFEELPTAFGKFWNLQSIIINTSTSAPTLNIKANIWNMSELRHFQTNIPAKLPLPSIRKGQGSSGLQTLCMVAPESCNKAVFATAWSLKKVCVRGQIGAFLQSNKDGFSTFGGLNCLENLKLISDVPCTSDDLVLPRALSRFLLNLKKLTLSKTMFDWSEANRLGQLGCLEVLKLKEDAFTGNSWKPERGGFRRLQVLWIQNDYLEYWEASGHHFPELRKLVLSCSKLESVPAELSQFQQ